MAKVRREHVGYPSFLQSLLELARLAVEHAFDNCSEVNAHLHRSLDQLKGSAVVRKLALTFPAREWWAGEDGVQFLQHYGS